MIFDRLPILFYKCNQEVMLIFLACTAQYSLLKGFLSEGIDNSAHIGGLAAGFLLGLLFVKNHEEESGI